ARQPADAAERGRNPGDLPRRVVNRTAGVNPAARIDCASGRVYPGRVPSGRVLHFRMHTEQAPHTGRELAALPAPAVALALAAALTPTLFVPCDFIAFWSSAILFADGHNPYDPALLLPLQYDAGFRLGYAITMFNPPWVLPLLAPLAALPVRSAFALGLAVQFALVQVAAGWLWRAFGGDARGRWVPAALALAFAPTFLLLTSGQLTGLAIFGLAGFLRFRPTRPILAGCLGALTAIKPHLFGLFALALALDAVRCRDGRRVILAGAVTLAVLPAVALAVDSAP